MSIQNRGVGPFPHLARAAVEFRKLAYDLDRIAGGLAPTAADLRTAPVLDDWRVVFSKPPHLLGTVHGHPVIADGRPCETSQLITFDAISGYARTLSRFYRLAPRPFGRAVQ